MPSDRNVVSRSFAAQKLETSATQAPSIPLGRSLLLAAGRIQPPSGHDNALPEYPDARIAAAERKQLARVRIETLG
jgi:hypothetical protein